MYDALRAGADFNLRKDEFEVLSMTARDISTS